MRGKRESIAERVRIERGNNPGLSIEDIAEIVGCTAKYADWVLWADKNRESRRRYERDRKRELYHADPRVADRLRRASREWKRANRRRGGISASAAAE